MAPFVLYITFSLTLHLYLFPPPSLYYSSKALTTHNPSTPPHPTSFITLPWCSPMGCQLPCMPNLPAIMVLPWEWLQGPLWLCQLVGIRVSAYTCFISSSHQTLYVLCSSSIYYGCTSLPYKTIPYVCTIWFRDDAFEYRKMRCDQIQFLTFA